MKIGQKIVDTKYDENKAIIEKILSNGSLSIQEQWYVRSRQIRFVKKNKDWVFFERDANNNALGYFESDEADHWYRTMSKADFIYLLNNSKIVAGSSYGGITPNQNYAAGYLTNKSDGTHTVEFKMNVTGKKFLEELHAKYEKIKGKKQTVISPKAEGGGTIGLGKTGMYGGLAGDLFNEMMGNNRIHWKLVACKVPLPGDFK